MYQSCFYSHLERKYWIRDDIEGWNEFSYPQTSYKRTSKPNASSLPVLTGGYADLYKGKLDKSNKNLLEVDIAPELFILRELYYQEDEKVPTWQNILFIDLETEIIGKLTPQSIKEAAMQCTSIALIDKTTKIQICFVVDKSGEIIETIEGDKYVIPCKSEKEMFHKFLDKWEQLDPTIVSTWNGDYFDIPYLYYRMCRVLGNEEALRLSPIRKINDWTPNPEVLSVKIGGINHLDYMLLFKKYIAKQEPSYKLGDVGSKYVDKGKIEYEGNLNQLFKNDKSTFINYNLNDVVILELLEEKFKFIELTILISHMANIPYESIFFNTTINEGVILKRLKREGIVSPNKPTTTNSLLKNTNSDPYLGGFLIDPKPGLYDWLSDFDYSSFYPSCIRSLNMGIETLVAKINIPDSTKEVWNSLVELKEQNPEDIIELEKLDKTNYTLKQAEIKVKDLIKYIEDNKWCIAANGVIFDTTKRGVMADILKEWYEQRVIIKKQMDEAFKVGNEDLGKLLDLKQHSFKILLNAVYGGMAINSFRYTDGYKMISSSITCTCQRLIQETIKYANELIDNEYINN